MNPIVSNVPIDVARANIDLDGAASIRGIGVLPCGGGNYCCYDFSNEGCCSTSSSLFHLDAATFVTTLTDNPTPNLLPSTTSISLGSTNTSRPASSSSTLTSDTMTIKSVPTTSLLASSVYTLATTSLPTATLAKSQASNDHAAVGVGVGIGVAVGMVVLGMVGYFLSRRQSRGRKSGMSVDEGQVAVASGEAWRPVEVDAETRRLELRGVHQPHELSGRPFLGVFGG